MTVHKQRLFRHALALPLATWILFAAGPSRAADEAAGPAAEAAGNSLQEDVGHGESDAQAFDNSHKNASPTIMHPQEFKSDLALFTLVVFILLLAILLKFAWGPITRGLEKREQGIADHIDQARLDAEQAAETLEQYDLLLEEQVYPFEEKAIDLYKANANRAPDGVYDEWVKKSFERLASLMPARYSKLERSEDVVTALY